MEKQSILKRVIIRLDISGISDIKDWISKSERYIQEEYFEQFKNGFRNNFQVDITNPEDIAQSLSIPVSAIEKEPLYLSLVTSVSYTLSLETNSTKVPIFKLFRFSTLLIEKAKLNVKATAIATAAAFPNQSGNIRMTFSEDESASPPRYSSVRNRREQCRMG